MMGPINKWFPASAGRGYPFPSLMLCGLLLFFPLIFSACGTGRTDETRLFEEMARHSLAQIEGEMVLPGLTAPVRVLRDEWGIPHIYARNRRDLFFAQGFVQAQDRLWQMDMWRRVNEGRLAEIIGPEMFEHDRLARLLLYRGDWAEEWKSYHPDGKMIFEAFSDGVNAWIEQIGDRLPVEYRLTGLKPLPWTPYASTGRVATALPIGDARAELLLARRIAREGVEEVNRRQGRGYRNWIDLKIPEGVDYSLVTEEVIRALSHFQGGFPKPPLLPEYQKLQDAIASVNGGARENSPGSNNWVVSGDLTESGKVLLANDPHRGVTNPSLRYLIHLDAPGYSVIGSTEPAIPGVAIGHNGHVGWGLTIVGTDQADVYMERLHPDDPTQALWNGEWYTLTAIQDTIPVRGEEPRVVTHLFSRHGPVFHVDSTNHVAWSIRSTASEPGTGGYLGALRLAETRNCLEFIEALAWYKSPGENMICGDTEGNISWLAAALTPDRDGKWFGRLPVPGTGEYEWRGFRDHMTLPHEINPQRGWIGTANHDIQPDGYWPPIMFRRGPFLRWERLQQMFRDIEDVTVEKFEQMLHDYTYPWLEEDRARVTGWHSDNPDLEWARRELAGWNGIYDKESIGAAIHYYWRRGLGEEVIYGAATPHEERVASEAALKGAVDELERRLGEDRDEWRWGRIHQSEFPHWLVRAYDLPAVERSGGGHTIAATGATFREIIDFADFDNSRATSTPGQSMQPGSPFYGNLLDLWGNETFFPLLYSQGAVEEHALYRLDLRPGR